MLIGCAWLIARLPLSTIESLGTRLGHLTWRLAKSRRLITETNIAKCFPQLDADAQQQMVRDSFAELGVGSLDLMIPWLNPKRDLRDRMQVIGLEHLEAAHAEGRGVVVVGAHYAVIDVISQPLSDIGFMDVMYRANKNEVWEWLQVTGRQRYFDGVIERKDMRQILRCLKKGRAIWYAADQDYGRKHSVFAEFFGNTAATITATSRLAKVNNSPVVLMRQSRSPGMRWQIQFYPAVDNFPTEDEVADATRMNALLEDLIRLHPAQYLWQHKRFKTRPLDEDTPFYPPGA